MRMPAIISAAALCLAAAAAQAEFNLTILHTNDVHARFEPINRFDSGCKPEDNAEGKCFGGSARLITAIREARDRAEHSILVDSGDQFQGTLFYSYYKGQVAAEMMTLMGYEAMAVGNHEFNHGPEVLRSFIDAVDFPVLMANADVSAEELLADAILKSTVIEVGGEEIGLIGLTPVDNDELSSPGPNIIFTDPVPVVQGEVDRLTAQGLTKIVVLSHSGHSIDQRIAAETTGVDVIIGGHSHTLLSNADDSADGPYPTIVNGVVIAQAYAYGKYLGELNVRFDASGAVTAATGDPLLIDASVSEDATVLARLKELAEPLEEIRNQVVAQTDVPIGGDRAVCRSEECEMGTLIADAMLDRVKDQGIQIAIQNGGGIRASIDTGEITMGEVLTVLPFQNTLSTFEMPGAGILAALENGVSQVEDGAGRFPQVAGMTFTWDPAAAPGSRIVSVEVAEGDGFVPLDPAKTYGVVTNNYVRNGGDGYDMFSGEDKNAYDYGPDLADVTAEYLAANAPYRPFTDGRIQRK